MEFRENSYKKNIDWIASLLSFLISFLKENKKVNTYEQTYIKRTQRIPQFRATIFGSHKVFSHVRFEFTTLCVRLEFTTLGPMEILRPTVQPLFLKKRLNNILTGPLSQFFKYLYL